MGNQCLVGGTHKQFSVTTQDTLARDIKAYFGVAINNVNSNRIVRQLSKMAEETIPASAKGGQGHHLKLADMEIACDGKQCRWIYRL